MCNRCGSAGSGHSHRSRRPCISIRIRLSHIWQSVHSARCKLCIPWDWNSTNILWCVRWIIILQNLWQCQSRLYTLRNILYELKIFVQDTCEIYTTHLKIIITLPALASASLEPGSTLIVSNDVTSRGRLLSLDLLIIERRFVPFIFLFLLSMFLYHEFLHVLIMPIEQRLR